MSGAQPAVSRRELWLASGGIIVALTAINHGIEAVPAAATILATLSVAIELYAPLLRARRDGVTPQTLGLRLDRLGSDLKWLVLLAALITPPFYYAYGWWKFWAQPFELTLPPDFLQDFLLQTLVLAFAEELYFRGYLQERWERWDPSGWRLFGVAWRPIVITSAIFAVVHFPASYNPARLAVFFPSLLFGLLRARTGTIVSATLFHAYCNALEDIMYYGYS